MNNRTIYSEQGQTTCGEPSRTIFITSFFGFIGRNLLSTGMLDSLSKTSNSRIVIFLPDGKKELYQKLFASNSNVIIEGIKSKKPTKLENLFSVLFSYLSDVGRWRMDIVAFRKNGQYLHVAFFWILAKLGHLKIIRRFARWADYVLMPKNVYEQYFEKYKPDVVFATDIFRTQDIYLMREARYHGVFILGMVRSWDNITSKGLNRIIPDKLVVNNLIIKDQAIQYNDVLSENIYIIGVPHYDRYITEPRASREKLFKKLNLDPNKKMVLISPPIRTYTYDPIAPAIIEALEPLGAQAVVRLHLMGKSNIGTLQSTPNKLFIDVPESNPSIEQTDLITGDDYLADLLYHSDVIISHISTLTIDAAVFNKPSIFIGFDVEPKPYHQGLRRFHDMEYLQEIRKTGGVKLAESLDELVKYTNQYLINPRLDEEGRKKILQEYCWKLDAQSSQRLTDVLSSLLTNIRKLV